MNSTLIVVGEGWSALTTVLLSLQASSESKIMWVAGTGSHLLPPTNAFEMGKGAILLEKLMKMSGIDDQELLRGKFLREFRNKSFREPIWNQSPTPEFKRESLLEWLSDGEIHFAPIFEVKFGMSLLEIFEELRTFALASSRVSRFSGFPVSKITKNDLGFEVTLANGETVIGDQVIYADRVSALRELENQISIIAPQRKMRLVDFERKCDARSVVQLVIEHKTPLNSMVNEHFFMGIHREADDSENHQVWGYFTEDGKRSVWSMVLAPGDADENHQIAKRLRRVKQSLNKTFMEGWLPEGVSQFTDLIAREYVRMEENIIFALVDPFEKQLSLEIDQAKIPMLVDGFGPEFAITQAAELVLGDAFSEASTSDVTEPAPA